MDYKSLYPKNTHEKLEKYIPYFSKYESKYQLPPGSLAAIAFIESGFDPNVDGDLDLADTKLGASAGMYQIRTGTGSDLGIVNYKNGTDKRKDVDASTDAVARLLKSNIEYFNGDINKAIQAHNGGRGNVGSDATLDYLNKWSQYIPDETDTTISNLDSIKDTVSTGLDTLQDKVTTGLDTLEDTVDTVKDTVVDTSDILADKAKVIYKNSLRDISNLLTGQPAVAETIADNVIKESTPIVDTPSTQTPLKDKNDIDFSYTVKNKLKKDKNDIDFSYTARSKNFNTIDITDTKDTISKIRGDKIPPKQIDISDLLKAENFTIITKYLRGRIEKPEFEELMKSTKSDVINYWLKHHRYIDYQFSTGSVAQLAYITNASREEAINTAKSHALYDSTPDFYELGLQRGAKALSRSIFYTLVDPTTLASLGVSAVLLKEVGKKGIKTILREKILAEKTKKGLKPFQQIKIPKSKLKKFKKEAEREKLIQKVKLGGIQVGVDAGIGVTIDSIDQQLDYNINKSLKVAELQRQYATHHISKDELETKIKNLKGYEHDTKRSLIYGGIYSLFGAGQAYGTLRKSNAPVPIFDRDELRLRQQRARPVFEESIEINEEVFRKEFEKLMLIDLQIALKNSFEDVNEGYLTKGATKLGLRKDVEMPEDLKKIFATKISDKYTPKRKLEDISIQMQKLVGKEVAEDILTRAGADKTKAQDVFAASIDAHILRKMMLVANEMLIKNPELKLLREDAIFKRQKYSDIVAQVFQKIDADKLNPEYFQDAIKKLNLNKEELSVLSRYTAGIAGTTLQSFKGGLYMLEKASKKNPAFKRLTDEIYGDKEALTPTGFKNKAGGILNVINKLERETKALLVAAFDTTVRNGIGTTSQMTLKTAQLLVDAAATSVYTNLESTISGTKIAVHSRPSGATLVEDSILAVANAGTVMRQALDIVLTPIRPEFEELKKLSADLVPQKLKDISNKIGVNKIFRSEQEVKDYFYSILKHDQGTADLLLNSLQDTSQSISRFAKAANVFNLGLDAFYRRIFFVNSVERQLAKKGYSLDKIVKDNAPIESEIIQQASQDAMEETFALDLKNLVSVRGKEYKDLNFESKSAVMAGHVVEAIDNLPGGSVAIATFPRFISNQIRKLYITQPLQFKFLNIKDTFSAKRIKERLDLHDEAIKLYDDLVANQNVRIEKLNKRSKKLSKVEYNNELKNIKDDLGKQLEKAPNVPGYNKLKLSYSLQKYSPKQRQQTLDYVYANENKKRQDLIYNISGATVGSALLAYGVKHSIDNPDLPVAHMRTDLGIVNMAYLAPIGMYLAAGTIINELRKFEPDEFYADVQKKSTELVKAIEVVAGIRIPQQSGVINISNYLLQNGFTSSIVGKLGDTVGDVLNRIQQPIQPIMTIIDSFDVEENLKRKDPKATEALEGSQLFFERAANQVNNRMGTVVNNILADIFTAKVIPSPSAIFSGSGATTGDRENISIADMFSTITPANLKRKVNIPDYISSYREGDVYMPGNLSKTLAGFRVEPRMTEIEREFDNLNYPWWGKLKEPADKTYERDLIAASIPYIIGGSDGRPNIIESSIRQEKYQNGSRTDKIAILDGAFERIADRAKADVYAHYMTSEEGSNKINRLYRIKFKRLKSSIRKAAMDIIRKKYPELEKDHVSYYYTLHEIANRYKQEMKIIDPPAN